MKSITKKGGIYINNVVSISCLNIMDDTYYINNNGEIYSSLINKKLKCSKDKYGYLRTCLKLNNGHKKTFYIHRIVAEIFVDKNGCNTETVDHIDGNKTNNFYKNLRWCSFGDNAKYAHVNGLNNQSCENNSQTKLTNNVVYLIIQDILNSNLTLVEIAKKYSCSYHAVKSINQKRSFLPIWELFNATELHQQQSF